MKPAPLDLPVIWRGCDWGPVTLKWKDANGDPFNLAGWQPRAESLNINLNARITDAVNGITTLSLNRIQTANLRLGNEKWDWLWERIADTYRYPPFLSGIVPIKEPQTPTTPPPGPPPANDDFENSSILDGDNGVIVGNNVNATTETGEPHGNNSVWYHWTPNRNWGGVLTLDRDWQYISVYTGDSVAALTHIATSGGSPSAVAWNIEEGVTYRIRIYTRLRMSLFSLTWDLTAP